MSVSLCPQKVTPAEHFADTLKSLLGLSRGLDVDTAVSVLKTFNRDCECSPESGCFKAQAQAVIAVLYPQIVPSRLYFEAHVTLDPVFGERRQQAEVIAKKHGFRLAKLIMRKREGDAETPHEDDTFMTTRSTDWTWIRRACSGVITDLRDTGFVVRRYKIEDTLVDSNHYDQLGCT